MSDGFIEIGEWIVGTSRSVPAVCAVPILDYSILEAPRSAGLTAKVGVARPRFASGWS
jgi:hypothetical protein